MRRRPQFAVTVKRKQGKLTLHIVSAENVRAARLAMPAMIGDDLARIEFVRRYHRQMSESKFDPLAVLAREREDQRESKMSDDDGADIFPIRPWQTTGKPPAMRFLGDPIRREQNAKIVHLIGDLATELRALAAKQLKVRVIGGETQRRRAAVATAYEDAAKRLDKLMARIIRE